MISLEYTTAGAAAAAMYLLLDVDSTLEAYSLPGEEVEKMDIDSLGFFLLISEPFNSCELNFF